MTVSWEATQRTRHPSIPDWVVAEGKFLLPPGIRGVVRDERVTDRERPAIRRQSRLADARELARDGEGKA